MINPILRPEMQRKFSKSCWGDEGMERKFPFISYFSTLMASIRILTHNTLNGPRNCLSGSLPTTLGFANLPESFSILDLVGCLYYLCLVMSVLFTLSLCSSKVDLSNPDEFRFKRSFNEMIRT